MVMNPYAFGAWQLQGAEPTSGYQMPSWGNMMANVGMGMLANGTQNPAIALGKGWQQAQGSQNDYLRAQLLNDEMNQKREKRNQLNQLMKQYQSNPEVQQRLMIGDLEGAMNAAFPRAASPTDDIKNYQYAIEHGLDPNTFGYAPQSTADKHGTVDIGGQVYPTVNGIPDMTKPYGPSSSRQQQIPQAVQTEAIKADTAFKSLSSALDKYEGLVSQGGLSVMPGQERDAIGQAVTDIRLQMKELYNLGVLNGPDLSLMEGMLFDPRLQGDTGDIGKMFGGDTGERAKASVRGLKEILQRVRDNKVNMMQGGGVPGAGSTTPTNSDPMEGRTATNPSTGQKLIRRNGQWVPQ